MIERNDTPFNLVALLMIVYAYMILTLHSFPEHTHRLGANKLTDKGLVLNEVFGLLYIILVCVG